MTNSNQFRMSCQGGQAKAARGAIAVRPNFFPELVSIDPKSTLNRLIEYRRKLEALEAA